MRFFFLFFFGTSARAALGVFLFFFFSVSRALRVRGPTSAFSSMSAANDSSERPVEYTSAEPGGKPLSPRLSCVHTAVNAAVAVSSPIIVPSRSDTMRMGARASSPASPKAPETAANAVESRREIEADDKRAPWSEDDDVARRSPHRHRGRAVVAVESFEAEGAEKDDGLAAATAVSIIGVVRAGKRDGARWREPRGDVAEHE